ncbi:MAG: hypothetical protein DME12_12920 [Candidatus Rokuibacteriota bacterium]|nr:MAG: hypothetical protein DME12_12920 [Candidatus Rokubacteria bacterium]PYM64488.1 MAG: hypothetical protein DME11_13585 [Candidatus Rokubacteria bacterium]PYN67371.1 MAG: hypothetical protein DMD93_15095 [Candidatus Rokubacteria bacterium]
MSPARVQRLLFIVGRQRRALYDSLRRTFDDDDTVQVVLDRRARERRRRRPTRRPAERRGRERRAQRAIDAQLLARGYAVVGVLTFQRPPTGTPEPAVRKAR